MARWTVLAGQEARDQLEADKRLLLQQAHYAFDMRHLDRLAIAFAPDGDMVAFAAPAGWTIRLAPQAVVEGLPSWLDSLTGRLHPSRQATPLPAFEITDHPDPAPWKAGHPLDCIPGRLSLDSGFIEQRPELAWAQSKVQAGRAEVTAFEIRCRTPPAWIELIADRSPAGGELHRVRLARDHATTRASMLSGHRDRLVGALHALAVPNVEIASLALVSPSRVSQIAAADRVEVVDARSLDQLLYMLSPPAHLDRTPREISFVFAKLRTGRLRAPELVSLQADLIALLRRTSEDLRLWTRRQARIDIAASKAIGAARKSKMPVADIARELQVTTKTVRLIERRHGVNQEPPGRKTAAALYATLADLGRLDLVPEERRRAHAATARRGNKRTERARERNVPAILKSVASDPP